MKKICQLMSSLLIVAFTSNAQTFSSKEVTIPTPDPKVKLSGTLSMPLSKEKHPAAILIWGNGPHTRDQEISGSATFKQISDYLNGLGMAVLRLDKRGFGNSTGDNTDSETNYTTRELANDIKSAYLFLNKQQGIDTTRVGLIGHSEGAIIACMLATQEIGVDWIIIYGPPAVRGDSIVAYQKEMNRKKLGMSAEVSAAVGRAWSDYARFIVQGYKNDSVYYQLGTNFLMAHGLDKNDERITHKFIDQLINGYKTKWYQYFFQLDPAQYIQKIKVPSLVVFGGLDDQVTVEQNFLPMHEAFKKSNNTNYRLEVLADEDHFFLRFEDQRMTKHEFGKMKVSDRLLDTWKGWLRFQQIIK